MAKKRLQKKREAAKTSAFQAAAAKAETPKITTKKVQPIKVETTKTEPVKVETKKTEPIKVETKKVEPAKVETQKAEAVKVETAKVESAKVETKKTETAKVETTKAEPVKLENKRDDDHIYRERLARHLDELKWLYCELYQDNPYVTMHLNDLLKVLKKFYDMRNDALKESDLNREKDPTWYKRNDLTGMMMYVNAFAGTLSNLESKLDYIQECNVNYLHLMPLLDSPRGRSDGGYAVADFRKVQEELGTMDDFAALTAACHNRGINVCLDFVMNHTSEDHEWAKRARAGEKEYQDRYFFFDNYDIPSLYEQTCPEVFPTTAPGNFTWLEDLHKHVMTTFYPYQWDLNYRNPRVFNEMMYNFLYLANKGIDIIRIDAVPYIWKELHTTCRNLPQVHTIVRMMRLIGELVCPGILLLGEVVMEPEKVVPYFGTVEKPECHMLYNVTTMATTWHTVATRDVSLLKKQLDIVNRLPKDYVFLNYLRCHDDIGWGLDFATLQQEGIQERAHKQYLNDYFRGYAGYSNSRGVLYNEDPVTGDARFCGTTASMCGIEKASYQHDKEALEKAIRMDVMLHAYMFMQSGIPVLYSGDEIGQLNDYAYRDDPDKAPDSRYVHRGAMNWEEAAKSSDQTTIPGQISSKLNQLEKLRKSEKAFMSNADTWTVETWDKSILCIGRYYDGDKIYGLFNFSEFDKTAWINERDGLYCDLLTGTLMEAAGVNIPAYGYMWLKKVR